MTIDGTVSGDRQVIVNLGRVEPAVRAELVKATGRITLKLMRESVQNKLSGQALKRRTGTLARAVTQSPRTYEAGPLIIGTVGVPDIKGQGGRAPVKYGRAHEYGFSGTVTVKEHLRTVKQAFGKPLKTPVRATVKAHSATLNLPERSFLRSALRDLQAAGVIQAEYAAAAAAGAKAATK